MFRKSGRKAVHYTTPDHRPMIPALREPIDPVELTIRKNRRNDHLIEPKEFLNWR